jgi:D-amino-acid dehydrogenase
MATQSVPIGALMNYSMMCYDDRSDEVFKSIEYGRGFSRGGQTADGAFATSDTSGDIKRFCDQLYDRLLSSGRFNAKFKTDVIGFVTAGKDRDAVTAVKLTNDEILSGDSFTVALGTGTQKLLKTLRIPCPIYPVKGYLVTFKSGKLVDFNMALPAKTFVAPLGPAGEEGGFLYRLSGFAEFTGNEETSADQPLDITSAKVEELLVHARSVFPDLVPIDADYGYRPLTIDDTPMIGAVEGIRGLYVNSGHGSKGWTMGAGSGKLLAQIIEGVETAIDMSGYDPNRFSWKKRGRKVVKNK